MIAIPLAVMLGALVLAGLPGPLPRWVQIGAAVGFVGGLLGGLGLLFASPALDSVMAAAAEAAHRQSTLVTAVLMALGVVLCVGGVSRAVDEVLRAEPDGPLINPGPPAAAALAGLLLLAVVVHERL